MLFLTASRFCRNLLEKKYLDAGGGCFQTLVCSWHSVGGEASLQIQAIPATWKKSRAQLKEPQAYAGSAVFLRGCFQKHFYLLMLKDKGDDWELRSKFSHCIFPFYVTNQRTKLKIKPCPWTLFAVYFMPVHKLTDIFIVVGLKTESGLVFILGSAAF